MMNMLGAIFHKLTSISICRTASLPRRSVASRSNRASESCKYSNVFPFKRLLFFSSLKLVALIKRIQSLQYIYLSFTLAPWWVEECSIDKYIKSWLSYRIVLSCCCCCWKNVTDTRIIQVIKISHTQFDSIPQI